MSIQIYILSKLLEEDNYPYKLKKELSEPIPFDQLGNLTESKLYYHFESLTKQGLVEPSRVIKEENRPDKQVYTITEKGRNELPRKIYELFEKANSIAEMIVGLMFLQHVEQIRILTILETKLKDLQKKQTKIKNIYSQIKVDDDVREMVDFSNDYISNKVSDEINWLDQLIGKLKKRSE